MLQKIDIKQSPESLAELCEKTENWFIAIDDMVDEVELQGLIDIHFNGNFYSKLVLSEVAKHKSANRWMLRKLFTLEDENINLSISSNENIDKELIGQLKGLDNDLINERLMSNPTYQKHYK